MPSSNGAMQNDVFQMGPGTLRSAIKTARAYVYEFRILLPACDHVAYKIHMVRYLCSISRAELHRPIQTKVRERCCNLLPEAQHGVILLKVRAPCESSLHARSSNVSIQTSTFVNTAACSPV